MLEFFLKNITFLSLGLFLIMASCSSGQNSHKLQTGLDRLVADEFSEFNGKAVGIICNHTARDKSGNHIVDLFHKNENVKVKAVFAPEHGFRGKESAGSSIDDQVDSKTGIKIYSLYGKIRKPTDEMLNGIDALVYDIQDVGVRFYTYISTMTYCMEAAAENNIPIYVLDRPNPIRGDIVEGAIRKEGYQSFVGMHPIPVRYGLTAGELATLINQENYLDTLKTNLRIIKMQGWKRDLWYDQTNLPWIAPSPNMPDLKTAIVYPGMCFLEGTNLSEGRGTKRPFLLFGAPWLNSDKMTPKLNQLNLAGVSFNKKDFTPIDIPGQATNPKYEDEKCGGIRLEITDRNEFRPIRTAIEIIALVQENYPKKFEWKNRWIDLLSGSDQLRKTIDNEKDLDSLIKVWEKQAENFKNSSADYYFY